jgi:hypothetical protein
MAVLRASVRLGRASAPRRPVFRARVCVVEPSFAEKELTCASSVRWCSELRALPMSLNRTPGSRVVSGPPAWLARQGRALVCGRRGRRDTAARY